MSSYIYMRVVSQEIPRASISEISLKIILNVHSNLPGVNQLKQAMIGPKTCYSNHAMENIGLGKWYLYNNISLNQQ